jgi:hypothetical protein
VAYSVMVWLVDPGEQAHQREAMQRTTTGRSQAPGAASGVNEPPAFEPYRDFTCLPHDLGAQKPSPRRTIRVPVSGTAPIL